MTSVSTLTRQGKLRLRYVDDCSRPAKRISFRGFPTMLQIAFLNIIYLYCQRKSPMLRWLWPSESSPLFILLPVPIENWREWRKAQKANALSVCVCAEQMLAWMHLCVYAPSCREQKVTMSSSIIFYLTLRRKLCLFIGNFKMMQCI